MKNKTLMAATLILAAGACASAIEQRGVKVENLGENNTLVRITGEEPILLLPVQESVDDENVNIIVDGKLDRTIRVRLAKNKVDYTVPFDLTPYKGKNVILDVTTNQNRSSVREARQDVCWSNITLTDSFDTTNREKYRPMFHHTPLYGWMNDPNGMVYKDGVWHLNYQWNPYGSKWENMTWGHSTSKDLINWEHHPATIEPNGLGTVFSGSCAVDTRNDAGFGKDAIIALYTSASSSQKQSLAHSTDGGMTFEIFAGNPIITLETEARDPNMFLNPYTGKWNLLLAHALEKEMLIYESDDLKNWTLKSSFGKGLGAQEGVWECPDLMELPLEGSDEKLWMLICNLNPGGIYGGSAAQYFIGTFDGTTFTPVTATDGEVKTKWMDYGKDHYATVSWSDAPDGRKIVIGWMSNWQYAVIVPTTQFRSANTLPRDLSLFKGDDGEIYLRTVPSPETLALRDKPSLSKRSVGIDKSATTFALPRQNSGVCEIELTIDPRKAEKVNLTLTNAEGDETLLTYNVAEATFSMNREKSGLTDFSEEFPATTTAPTFAKAGSDLKLRMFIDTSSIEIFGNDGKFAMTNLVFPTSPYTTLKATADGKAKIEDIKIYPMIPTQNN